MLYQIITRQLLWLYTYFVELLEYKSRWVSLPSKKGTSVHACIGTVLLLDYWPVKLVKSQSLNWTEIDSNRGSKCFGCLVSAETHGDDGCQVLFREALCGCGPGARAAAWQHQRGREVCSQSEREEHEHWKEQSNWLMTCSLVYSHRSAYLGHPYGP